MENVFIFFTCLLFMYCLNEKYYKFVTVQNYVVDWVTRIPKEKGTTEDEIVGWPSPIQWTWVWVDSGSWWWTGRPDVLWFMGSQRVRHYWATELNWGQCCWTCNKLDLLMHSQNGTQLYVGDLLYTVDLWLSTEDGNDLPKCGSGPPSRVAFSSALVFPQNMLIPFP